MRYTALGTIRTGIDGSVVYTGDLECDAETQQQAAHRMMDQLHDRPEYDERIQPVATLHEVHGDYTKET